MERVLLLNSPKIFDSGFIFLSERILSISKRQASASLATLVSYLRLAVTCCLVRYLGILG